MVTTVYGYLVSHRAIVAALRDAEESHMSSQRQQRGEAEEGGSITSVMTGEEEEEDGDFSGQQRRRRPTAEESALAAAEEEEEREEALLLQHMDIDRPSSSWIIGGSVTYNVDNAGASGTTAAAAGTSGKESLGLQMVTLLPARIMALIQPLVAGGRR